MHPLSAWTAGLVGDREPAQPLLTLLDGPARVELSGATTANWVAKSANLLVDGLGAPDRIGLLLPLHWQTVVLVLAGVATGAQVVLAADVDALAGCDVAFTGVEHAGAALELGLDEVLAVSLHPLGAPPAGVPALALDHAREVPGHGDHWSGPAPTAVRIEVAGRPLGPLPTVSAPLGPDDRVLLTGRPADLTVLGLLLAVLAAGAAVVLVPEPAGADLAAAARAEQATATAGLAIDGLVDLSR